METLLELSSNPFANDETAQVKSKKEKKAFNKSLWLSIFFCLIALLLFFWQQWKTWSFSDPIDYNLFGTLGDFIGGFLGTFIALYSVYMLVRTFQNQIVTNENVIKTNKSIIEANNSVIETNRKLVNQTLLQIFDSRLSAHLKLYKESILAYRLEDGLTGRAAFEKIVNNFKNEGLDNKTEYKRRSMAAVSKYVQLYINERQLFSVHFRMLYLLARLTAEEKMYEKYRVSYAKSIRGQLSEGELLILRYNCLSPYGEKMRLYVNKFNLIKHLPITHLLEFTYWRKILAEEKESGAIDQLAITIKKIMCNMLDKEGKQNNVYNISSRLSFQFCLSERHDKFITKFILNKHKKRGGAIERPAEEKAFDQIPTDELTSFFLEMYTEFFLYSNFFQFNGDDHHIVKAKATKDDDNEIVVEINVERPNKHLALAQRQVMPT